MRPGFHSVTPYLIARGASAAIEFYKQAFGAVELMRAPAPDGQLMHSELQIGDSHLMMADEHPDMGYVSPLTLGKSPVAFMLYVEDADAVYQQAIAAGAKSVRPMSDQPYGRSGCVEDPFGYQWYVTTHK
jgi:PhnB protein